MNKLISSTPKKRTTYKKHPTTEVMVDEAFKVLNKCSYRAVKHFILTQYLVDMRFLINKIKSYIRESVANGKLIQMTGHGLNGSFRLSAAAKRNPNKFLKKNIWKINIIKPKKKNKLVNRPTIAFVTDPIRRRTSLTRASIRKSLCRLGRSPKPRLAKNKSKIGIISDDENDDLPSTSSEAIHKLTKQCSKLSDML